MSKRKTIPAFSSNPFKIKGIENKWRKLESGEYLVARKDTGEQFIQRELKSSTVEVDTLQYTKVFNNEFKNILNSLTFSEFKMWGYILINLIPNKDEITLDFEEVKKFYDWKSVMSVYEALRGLVTKDVLAKSWKGNTTYWINTNLFFNGDRRKI